MCDYRVQTVCAVFIWKCNSHVLFFGNIASIFNFKYEIQIDIRHADIRICYLCYATFTVIYDMPKNTRLIFSGRYLLCGIIIIIQFISIVPKSIPLLSGTLHSCTSSCNVYVVLYRT